MKRLLIAAFASLAFTALADGENTSYSPNIGVTEISPTLQNTIIPVKFTSLAGGTEGTIKAVDLVHPVGIPSGTQLYVFVNNKYEAFVMGTNEWAPLTTTSTSDPSLHTADIGQVAVAGTAIWLVFPGKPADTQKVYIYGEVVANPTSAITEGTKEAPVSNLLCNPTDSAVAIGEKLSGITLAKGDKIIPIGATFAGEYVYSGSVWWHVNPNGTIDKANVTLPSIPANGGFWFVSKGGIGAINW